jgi:hypothetical protein
MRGHRRLYRRCLSKRAHVTTPEQKLELFTRRFTEHKLACGGLLEPEWDRQTGVLELSCSICRLTFREQFTLDDAFALRGTDFERLWEGLECWGVN